MNKKLLALCIALGFANAGYSAEVAQQTSADMLQQALAPEPKFSIGFGIVNPLTPVPAGIIASYKVLDFLKVEGRYAFGWDSRSGATHSYGLGLVAFAPTWEVSPTLGLHWAAFQRPGYFHTGVGGFGADGRTLLISFGGTWQPMRSIAIGGGLHLPLMSRFAWAPYASIEYCF